MGLFMSLAGRFFLAQTSFKVCTVHRGHRRRTGTFRNILVPGGTFLAGHKCRPRLMYSADRARTTTSSCLLVVMDVETEYYRTFFVPDGTILAGCKRLTRLVYSSDGDEQQYLLVPSRSCPSKRTTTVFVFAPCDIFLAGCKRFPRPHAGLSSPLSMTRLDGSSARLLWCRSFQDRCTCNRLHSLPPTD